MSKRVKLVCTLGPASASPEAIRELADAGTDVFRVNLSHGSAHSHAELATNVRGVARELGTDIAVMADLPGPKIRLGELAEEPLKLIAGQRFVLRTDGAGNGGAAPRGDRSGAVGNEEGAAVTYAGLGEDVRAGDRVLLSDGAVELVVVGTGPEGVTTQCVRGGQVRSRAGVNVPAERLSVPAITERDREGLDRALRLGVDLVAQSFVRSASDVIGLRSLMGEGSVPIVAKIETRPAVDDFAAILEAADAIMVARGDLGVELPMEEIPVLQKELLAAARGAGKPAIVATQMLESMIRSPRPTRAEANDVANAVLDGADAIMLSGETAIGEFPVDAALAASRIAQTSEERAAAFRRPAPPHAAREEAEAVARAVAEVARFPEVVAIACFTRTGRTAALLSAERPTVPIYAFIPDPTVRRQLAIRWGVITLPADDPEDTDSMIALMDGGLREAGVVADGQDVVMAASSPAGRITTNMLKLHRLGDPIR